MKKDEIEEELKKVQEQNAREITIEDRAVKDGDILTIDYSGSVDGVKFEGGTAEDQTLVIGSGAFIPGFEEQLVGKDLNETADINVTFPEEYHAPDLAGKDAVFTVTVKAIKEKELPELDDEFAAEVSEFETLEDYKADIKEKIRDRKKEAANTERENKIAELEKMAGMYQMETEQLEKIIQGAQKDQMMDDIAVQKAVDFLVGEAK